MGFKATIGGRVYEMLAFSVQESSTPLAAGDSSGSVGTITLELPFPDPDLQPNHPVIKYGSGFLVGKTVRLDDSRKGFTLGKVHSTQRNHQTGNLSVSCLSRLGDLNVYNLQANPFVGTLSAAFNYYLSLVNVTTDIYVDPAVASKPVVFPGWSGELWYNLKQLATAVECDVSLVSGVIILRPIRTRVATRGRDIDRTNTSGGGTLAQFIEAYKYNNTAITNKLVYPPGGWSEKVTTINVNAGETVAEVLELSSSLSSIQQPVMQTFVSKDYQSSSVFTAVGDDGLPIQPSQWTAFGGSLRVEINPDTTSVTVHITAPSGLPGSDGELIGTFGIALSSDESTGRYSTLRLVGSGVAFNKELIRVPTGIPPSQTSTVVGLTIDNPFLSTADEVYRAASRAVRGYNGTAMQLTGTVVSINQLGDTGEVVVKTYAEEAALHPGGTYATVQTAYAGLTYQQVQEQLNAGSSSLFENQVFGNTAGARIWDKGSARWYRIRSATLPASAISFEAEDDLMHSDVQAFNAGLTYATVQTRYTGFTYNDVDLMGLR